MRKLLTVFVVLISLSCLLLASTEITFWYAWGGSEGRVLLNLVEEFNQIQDEVVVRPVFVPIGQGEKITTALAGTSTPDIVTVWDWMVVPLGDSGALLPLNSYLNEAGITSEDYIPGIWDYGAYLGTKYGLPTTLNVYAFMWNKNLYREVGLDPERPPSNLEELEEYSDLFFTEDRRGNIRRLGFLPVISHIYFYVFGGQLWDAATGEVTANHPKNVEALEWVASYYKKYDIQRIRVFEATWGEMASPFNPFYRGQKAMQEAGQWELLFIEQFATEDFDYGVTSFPAPEGGRGNVAFMNGSFWAIPARSRNPDAAFDFLNWLTATAQAARFSAELSNIPPRVDAFNDPAYLDHVHPNMEIYLDMVTNGYVYYFPMLPIGLFYMNELNQALQYVQSGQKSAKEALDEVQQNVVRELQRYR